MLTPIYHGRPRRSRSSARRAALGLAVCLWALGALADVTYLVKKNDSLTSIARRYGLSVARLASHNGLKDKDKILIGQRLRIPTNKTDPAAHPALPKNLKDVRLSNRWKKIVIHHSAASQGNIKSMDRYHREVRHMENGLAYHFVIGNGRSMKDGEVAAGARWLKQLDGGHLKSQAQNQTSIGICLVGNFDRQKPSARQMESLRALVLYLMDRCNLDAKDVQSHQQINILYTRCPGKHFPWSTFMQGLNDSQ